MKAAAMDPDRLAGLVAQAARADEAEARTAAVIAVMRRIDALGKRHRAALRDEAAAAASFHRGAYVTTGTVNEELRVALGLPNEWRDGPAPEDPRADPDVGIRPTHRCKHCKLEVVDLATWVGCDACEGDGLVAIKAKRDGGEG